MIGQQLPQTNEKCYSVLQCPGSGGTRESTVSLEPGSDGASARACECAWKNVQTQKFTFALDVQAAKQCLKQEGAFSSQTRNFLGVTSMFNQMSGEFFEH